MRKTLLILSLLVVSSTTFAHHLKGGWIFYEYLGKGSAANTSKYRITVNQYLACNSTPQQVDQQIYLGIFDGATNALTKEYTVPINHTEWERIDQFNPCINNPPEVCYRVDKYIVTVDLPDNNAGYTLSVQRCCRIGGIVNVLAPSDNYGVTYTTHIPGVIQGVTVRNNNCPLFAQQDAVIICVDSKFTFNFSATDQDKDSLAYVFCDGLQGGDPSPLGAQPNPTENPPYIPIPYAISNGFTGSSPMGPNVTIDEKTGIITGVAPSRTGDYVVAVCVEEFRNGIKIGQTKKEIHITVADCSLSAAQLKPSYITCNGFDFTFFNESSNTNINRYFWDFGVPVTLADTSAQPRPTFIYPDTGIYAVKLIVSNTQGCVDSAESSIKIFPGFTPDFTVDGSCLQTPYQFYDKTKTAYGVVDSWKWNFGDPSSDSNLSIEQNPLFKYNAAKTYPVTLIATNSKGCIDTITKQVEVRDKPAVYLPFKDTLICSIDSLQLSASTDISTSFKWQSADNHIINANTATPTVFPKDTALYLVTVDDGKGCINTDSVTVNVIDHVMLDVGRDTSICLTDTIQFHPSTNGLYFAWSPTESISDPFVKEPFAIPSANTKYSLMASVGKCNTTDDINVLVAPYPVSNPGFDTAICYGSFAKLNASITGSSFTWSPAGSLDNPASLSPVAYPNSTTTYILTVTDTLGCPKPVSSPVVVKVIPPVRTFAGNDTNIVANQPLQLNATGAANYTWLQPAPGISNPNIPNPVAVLNASYDTVLYVVRGSTPEGCFANDSMKVVVFKTLPEIFIPTAFTPNADGRNDELIPIMAGMQKLEFFRIYNRWGQMLFNTSEIGKGWDGAFNGTQQASGTYVFMARAIDFSGNPVLRKGTVVLIR
ncbi:MAG: PKD domain-containing protein [Ilyomonas sp.]